MLIDIKNLTEEQYDILRHLINNALIEGSYIPEYEAELQYLLNNMPEKAKTRVVFKKED